VEVKGEGHGEALQREWGKTNQGGLQGVGANKPQRKGNKKGNFELVEGEKCRAGELNTNKNCRRKRWVIKVKVTQKTKKRTKKKKKWKPTERPRPSSSGGRTAQK